MTPGKVRDRLSEIQSNIRTVEMVLEEQGSASVGYSEICNELVEGWESIDRAVDILDKMVEERRI